MTRGVMTTDSVDISVLCVTRLQTGHPKHLARSYHPEIFIIAFSLFVLVSVCPHESDHLLESMINRKIEPSACGQGLLMLSITRPLAEYFPTALSLGTRKSPTRGLPVFCLQIQAWLPVFWDTVSKERAKSRRT